MLSHVFEFLNHITQRSFYPFIQQEISVLYELLLGHLRYHLTDVPPQPNSQSDYVLNLSPLFVNCKTDD